MRPNILTRQQTKVLLFICQELPPMEIARRMKISDKTFFNHRAKLISKTKAKTNIGLYKYALLRGYVTLNGLMKKSR